MMTTFYRTYRNPILATAVTLISLVVLFALFFIWPVPQLAAGVNPLTVNPLTAPVTNPLDVVAMPPPATEAPATEAPATEPPAALDVPVTPTPSPEPVVTESLTPVPAVTVDYKPLKNGLPLFDKDMNVLGFFYAINAKNQEPVSYPLGSTIMIALGNGKISVDGAEFEVASDGTIGNIVTDICPNAAGCTATLTEYTPGHVGITVVFAGKEIPNETLAGAVNRMLAAPNCGDAGCKTINLYSKAGQKSFTAPTNADGLAGLLTAPVEPFPVVNVVNEGVPADAKVLLNDKTPVGQEYHLASTEAYVSVPEGGLTIVQCGVTCTINGKEYAAGSSTAYFGTSPDRATPADQNMTLEIRAGDPTMVRIIMYYAGDPQKHYDAVVLEFPDYQWTAVK